MKRKKSEKSLGFMLFNLGNGTSVNIELFDSKYGTAELYVVRDMTANKAVLSAVVTVEGTTTKYLYLTHVYCVKGQEFTEQFVKYLINHNRCYVDYITVGKYLISNQFRERYGFVESLYEDEEGLVTMRTERKK